MRGRGGGKYEGWEPYLLLDDWLKEVTEEV